MLYHISKIAGLKILKPQVSTHKKAYVYAIENVVTGLLFGAPHDDFDFIISEENGISQPRIKNDGLAHVNAIFRPVFAKVHEPYSAVPR